MTSDSDPDPRRRLPSITRLLDHPLAVSALTRLPRSTVVESLRSELAAVRGNGSEAQDDEQIVAGALARAEAAGRPTLRRAINATGVVLHTGLGRAVLGEAARAAVEAVASGHSLLEIDAETGRRGSRQTHVRELLRELTGAESALVLNNNAGAVFLCVTALASGREVIISRGELVEIGGSFRMPDIIRASGASLVEVGTTNKTRLADFERAITENTGLLLRCHPSNFKIVGFSEEAPAGELAALGNRFGIPVMDDLGSGAIVDLSALGAGPTTTLRAAVETGCDVITASGDKLLGGPQCGIVLGRKECVDRIAAHPLARALRVDKLTLAALEATLRLYRDPAEAIRQIPTLKYLSRSVDELRGLAEEIAAAIGALPDARVDLVDSTSEVGGGSLPGENLPTICVRIHSSGAEVTGERLICALRMGDPPIFGRIREDALLLDPRTVEREEIESIAQSVRRAFNAS